jgi:hypothetical protein
MRLMAWLLLSVLLAKAAEAQRTFWPVSIDSMAVGRYRHTHVAVTGRVAYTAKEEDGDVHIKLVSAKGAFIIAECIPELPCVLPKAGTIVTVKGISRRDPEHLWYEVHPVEAIVR